MPNSTTRGCAEPCVWMSASLLDYKLCDRGFDCERCPLDAALRGQSLESPERKALLGPGGTCTFPSDRLYSTGHTWVRGFRGDGKRDLRLGVDTFAAAIIGQCNGIRWKPTERTLEPRETVCEIDLGLGLLPLGAPLRCQVLAVNRSLGCQPSLLVTAPYGEGWILDLTADSTAEFPELLSAGAARARAELDLRRFRRRVALQLFSAAADLGPSLADGGEHLVDLRQMLGGASYLDLLRDLVH